MHEAWLCQNTLNPLINYGYMEEVIVAAVYNTDDRINEYTYSYDQEVGEGGLGDQYLNFI